MIEKKIPSIKEMVTEYSSSFNTERNETAVILAAGHGKRIKSNTSKMLHKIWEVPTVERVTNACQKGLNNSNIIIVVGIKADDVMRGIGKRNFTSFAYQEVQNGTGHALQVAMENIPGKNYDGTVYVFPGDMGLLDPETVRFFKNEFEKSDADMMVLTGIFDGKIEDNYYGRIVRVKNENAKGSKLSDLNKVIEILEYKDILNLDEKKLYSVQSKGTKYKFSQKELIDNREFNSGVYAFKFKPLMELIDKIQSNNVQKEIYLTDLIALFNNSGYNVEAVFPKDQYVLMGFNNKSVLQEMNAIAKKMVYNKLKDVITIDDPDDFFVDESVVEEILNMDADGKILDIKICKGAYVGKGVKLNLNVSIGKNVLLKGDIHFGKNVTLHENTQITCFYGQSVQLNDYVEIFPGNIIKGNVSIGANSKLESWVRITGSDQYPARIGNDVSIKGTTYIFGSQIEDHIFIEQSVLIRKKVSKPAGIKSEIYTVKYYLPAPEGEEAVRNL